ncbi:MAG: hypothetical protein IJM30_02275 [Thermoguttaceae bacterium]|nr:hypothetical protein [Thermoguttaceae bacterium]
MTRAQREEYVAPICEVLSFQIEESVAANSSQGQAEFGIGQDAVQEDDEE